MKRKRLLFESVAVPAIAGSILLINRFLIALPVWAIRAAGIILLAGLVVLGFLIARSVSGKKITG